MGNLTVIATDVDSNSAPSPLRNALLYKELTRLPRGVFPAGCRIAF